MSGADFEPSELWGRRCFDEHLNYLGTVEALGFRRHRVRAIGLQVADEESQRLAFIDVTLIQIDLAGDLLINASAGSALGRVRVVH